LGAAYTWHDIDTLRALAIPEPVWTTRRHHRMGAATEGLVERLRGTLAATLG
jgi:hypothetical protein